MSIYWKIIFLKIEHQHACHLPYDGYIRKMHQYVLAYSSSLP
jgi:hypothetical protein